jgi:uncharacterized membrane protein YccF (DUF307 family)
MGNSESVYLRGRDMTSEPIPEGSADQPTPPADADSTASAEAAAVAADAATPVETPPAEPTPPAELSAIEAAPAEPAPAPVPPAAPTPSLYVVEQKTGRGLFVRALWYLFIGWWLTAIVVVIAWIAALTIIGLPLSFYLVNHIPTALTLRPHIERYEVIQGADGVAYSRQIRVRQSNVLVRIAYFVLIGWWLSAIWTVVAYAFSLTVIGLPIGLAMFNRLPFLFSLHRGYA